MNEYITVKEAQVLLGKPSYVATDIWLRRRGIRRFTNPSDSRRVLFLRSDIESLTTPALRTKTRLSP